MPTRRTTGAMLTILLALPMLAEEASLSAEPPADPRPVPAAGTWVRLAQADLGRHDAPLVYEPALKRFMVLGGSVSWAEYPKPHPFDELALDPAGGQWENWLPRSRDWGPRFDNCQAPRWKSESWGLVDAEGNCRPNVTTLCSASRGVVAWAEHASYETSLFLLDAQTRTWSKLPLKGKLPRASADEHGMVYDGQRDRLLLFSGADKNRGDVMAYDMTTGEAQWLLAAGKGQAGVRSRESVYLPEHDAVLIGKTVAGADGESLWLLYDCRKNAWFGVNLGGAGPIGKDGSMVSLGLMHDPARKLVWATDQHNRVFVLKLDRKTAKMVEYTD